MKNSYEFYLKELGLDESQVKKKYELICKIQNDLNNNSYDEEEIRKLDYDSFIIIILEDKIDLFKRLVSLFPYDDNGVVRYRYLVDVISLGVVDKIKYSDNLIDSKVVNELLTIIYYIDYDKAKTMRIRDVLPRQISGMGHPVISKNDVIYYSELPLLQSALDCFDKNIITTSNDTEGCYYDNPSDVSSNYVVNLMINYDTLDENNKVVADSLIESGNARLTKSFTENGEYDLIVYVKVSPLDTVEEVSDRLIALFTKFSKQDMLFGHLTLDDIENYMNNQVANLSNEQYNQVLDILDNGWSDENVLKALEYFPFIFYYYDPEEKIFWQDEFYCQCHKKYLAEQLNQVNSFKQ